MRPRFRPLLYQVIAGMLSGLLAGEPLVAASSAGTFKELAGDARIEHALNRFTFGPRPGDVAEVRRVGLDRWFEQQLHPATLDDSAFESRLAQLPAMRLPQAELMARFPSQQTLRMMARTNASLPADPVEHAIYRNGIAFEREREARQAEKDAKPAETAMVGGAEAEAKTRPQILGGQAASQESGLVSITEMSNADAVIAGTDRHRERFYPEIATQGILALAPQARVSRLLALEPDDLRRFRASLSANELNQVTAGMSPEQKETVAALRGGQRVVAAEVLASRLERDIASNRQLETVMTDFWLNHFNVYVRKNQIESYLLPAYERETIRPHALGRFEDLLRATASSPAMLVYLDNAQSTGPHSAAAQQGRSLMASLVMDAKQKAAAKERGLNENYARELMELHTVGVRCEASADHTPTDPTCGAGYSQADVTEVARVLTGWTVTRPQEGSLAVYQDRRHEPGDKHVLGHTIANGGEREGVQLLHLLATSPATAQFICTKLAVRFVSDAPPPALVDRMTAAWRASDGDISTVLRAMFHAPEFWSPAVERSKVKTPLEFVVSAVRASDAEVLDSRALVQALNRLGMPLYGMQTPNGYSWMSEPWVSTGALVTRMNFALLLAGNRLAGTTIDWSRLAGSGAAKGTPLQPVQLTSGQGLTAAPVAAEARSLEFALLGRPVSSRTEQAVVEQAGQADLTHRAEQEFLGSGASGSMDATAAEPGEGQTAVMAGLLLGSPEFQRR